MFSIFKNKNFAIDLGNNNTLLTDENRILLSQPSYIVFNNATNDVKAIGNEAFAMYEKSHDELKPVKPLRGGVIADYDSASAMIREMVKRACMKSMLHGFDNIVSGVPYNTTEVERRALRDALGQFNSRKTYLLYEPLAAALGMGLNIQEPEGKLVIDIGGGITEIVVISLSGIAAFQSVKVAGDTFDENIQDYFRRNYNMAIGHKTAEQVKIRVGAATAGIPSKPEPALVKGKDMVTGIPITRKITHEEVAMILDKSITSIETAIIQTLETCPPELAADIYQSGIYLTGGGALLRGLKERLERNIRLDVHVDQDALQAVTKGIGTVLKNTHKYRGVLFE